ncbi:lactonase family protein [soil metagenome]
MFMRNILLFLFLFSSFLDLKSQAHKPQEYHLLIGTYSSEQQTNGIHVYRFNTQSGDFKMAQPVTELKNASYLAISKDRKNVYSLGDGGVHAFEFNPVSGALSFINKVPSQGPAYVSVDDQKNVVFAGNYGGGSVLAVTLDKDGSFSDNLQTIQHEGSSINKERQENPHVHAVVLSPDDQYLLVPDLGTDKVYQYRVNASQQQVLKPADPPFLAVNPGGGPRHLAFHPNGNYSYLVLELEGAVMALEYRKGKLEAKQTLSMVDPDFKGRVSGADIHVSPDGRFLYASNRGDANEIAIYSIDKQGKLTFVNRQSVFGRTPRNFVIDPTGNFLLVANQDTNEVIVFNRNLKTGLLTPTGKRIEAEKPVCLKFVAVGEK